MTTGDGLWGVRPSGAGSGRWAISAGSVLLPDGELAQGLDVVVAGQDVEAVLPRGRHGLPPGQVVDAPGATLLPGLIDSHVHLTFSADAHIVENVLRESPPAQLARATGNAQKALAAGVTTAVDCGGQTEVVIALRDGIAAGILRGPRLLVTGAPLTTTAGHCHWLGGTADSQEDLIRRMRQLVASRVDVIKVMLTGGNITAGSNPARLQFPPEAIAALAGECERLGKPLVAHAHTVQALDLSAAVGARVIAHGTCTDRVGAISLGPETVAALADAGCYLDPTLMVGRPGSGDGSDRSERRLAQRTAMVPLYRQMWDAGVRLLAGTDAGVPGVPHGMVAQSMVALHREVGMPPGAALLAGTTAAAEAYGIHQEVGSLRAGLRADLLLVDGLVQDDFEAITRPLAVWQSGALAVSGGLLSYA